MGSVCYRVADVTESPRYPRIVGVDIIHTKNRGSRPHHRIIRPGLCSTCGVCDALAMSKQSAGLGLNVSLST